MMAVMNRFLRSGVRFANRFRSKLFYWYFRRRLSRQAKGNSNTHKQYLVVQLQRTLSKMDAPLQPRTRLMVDRIAQHVDLIACDVLCVGCRNSAEIDYFAARGARRVVGIDLYSRDERILVMDMHAMTFPDDSFDVVYASHSLEHARDVTRVASEIARVGRPGGLIAIEVPAHYETRGADLVDFGSLQALHGVFADYLGQIYWSDEQPANSPTNEGARPLSAPFSPSTNNALCSLNR